MREQPTQNFVTGGVRHVLRLEALLLGCAALVAYHHLSANWWQFAALVLLPDVALLAYAAGPRVGAWAYNATHSYAGPWAVAAAAVLTQAAPAQWVAVALIWVAHIALDRALGYGLKYPIGFGTTHLGCIGRASLTCAQHGVRTGN